MAIRFHCGSGSPHSWRVWLALEHKGFPTRLFAGAMVAVICGLAWFLREVYLATHTIHIDLARFE